MAYFLEVGIILVFVPWSDFWEHNYFAQSLPFLQVLVKSPFVRGAVSGVGVLNILAGFADLRSLIPWNRA